MNIAAAKFTGLARTLALGALVISLAPVQAFAQQDRRNDRGFWVTGTSEVTVRPDEALIVMQLRSTGPTVAEAFDSSEQTIQQLSQSLNSSGLQLKYTFTSSRVSSWASGNRLAPLYQPRLAPQPMRPFQPAFQLCGTEAIRYVIVTFDADDLAGPGFEKRAAVAIDTLVKGGAEPAHLSSRGDAIATVGPLLFTLKIPENAELESVRLAQARAKQQAEHVAAEGGFKLGGIIDARVNRPLMVTLPQQQDLSILDELHIRVFSASKDAITIPATFAVEYAVRK
jgi:uncharacterized protein YggE